ncbi:zinc finger CCCH domain-containing protein 53-like [Salvia miltiorrhiza]|uniref:zinc finger CCCH domain-containing protein 53-like n=1 Tax=Salvia miltiorrhiza TaxID=226208 RepID=UPI0025AC1C23|nr:zinc finger CCCH domain-containing protein 53-like [Salvia miltiorrhiza]
MDKSEATNIVMSRIQALDPENASKIMGYILIQDLGEKEMIRLAFSPDALLLYQAKAALASPYPFHSNSPRIMIPTNNAFNFTGPSSPFQRSTPRPIYAAGNDDSFLDDPIISPSGRSDSLVFPYADDVNSPHAFHRRSCSVNDAAFLANLEDGGGGNGNGFLWRPCMYFARGFCKNGGSCKFLHADNASVEAADVGSPGGGFDEMMKMKAFQQQRLAAMASGAHNLFAYNKCMDENLRGDLSPMGLGSAASSSARQIYLTFPADSTFKEEDVSNYFSMFGPVQDVRIPYQQKRMFGFVTFVYPETVKLILAKGNPHFVCDSRVLVKPYKEKGKVREKKHQQQQLERGEYSSCLSPSGIDSREHFDHPFGPRLMFSPQEMILRKKLEHEAELQHAIELEGQRMLRLQLRDLKAQNHNNHYMQMFPSGVPYSSPRTSQLLMNQHVTASSHAINEDDPEESNDAAADEKFVFEGAESSFNNNDSDLHQSMEHVLPDNLFASPTKSASENQAPAEGDDGRPASSIDTTLLPGGSPLTMASLKSCYLQMPRFSSGQEAIEM